MSASAGHSDFPSHNSSIIIINNSEQQHQSLAVRKLLSVEFVEIYRSRMCEVCILGEVCIAQKGNLFQRRKDISSQHYGISSGLYSTPGKPVYIVYMLKCIVHYPTILCSSSPPPPLIPISTRICTIVHILWTCYYSIFFFIIIYIPSLQL